MLISTSKFRKKYFSQYGECVLLSALFLGQKNGSYIDVGAGHPIDNSVSYRFYINGWRGVTIDPIKKNHQMAKKLRKFDKHILAACTDRLGQATFNQYSQYEFSTSDPSRVLELASMNLQPEATFTLPTITLESLEVAVTPDQSHFLSIDVEGSEMKVLKGNDFNSYLPGVICIEERLSPLGFSAPTEISKFLTQFGYQLEAYLSLSSIYVHQDANIRDLRQ